MTAKMMELGPEEKTLTPWKTAKFRQKISETGILTSASECSSWHGVPERIDRGLVAIRSVSVIGGTVTEGGMSIAAVSAW